MPGLQRRTTVVYPIIEARQKNGGGRGNGPSPPPPPTIETRSYASLLHESLLLERLKPEERTDATDARLVALNEEMRRRKEP